MEYHVGLAEKALGKPLPTGVIVHHFDGDAANNTNHNLVICPDKAYHSLLHARLRAFRACGNPNWGKCAFCRDYDDPSRLVHYKKPGISFHPSCRKAYDNGRRTQGKSTQDIKKRGSEKETSTTAVSQGESVRAELMSSKDSSYRFRSALVKQLIKEKGGLDVVAVALHTTARTLQRTISNQSLNGRTQRDLLRFLGVDANTIGYVIRSLL